MGTRTKPDQQPDLQSIAEAQKPIADHQNEQSPAMTPQLPPEHVDHAAVYYNEHAIRKQGFEAGLAAIDAEIEGKKIEREEKLAEIERVYSSDMASLERRRTMMVIGIEMAGAALEKFQSMRVAVEQPPQQEEPPAPAPDMDHLNWTQR